MLNVFDFEHSYTCITYTGDNIDFQTGQFVDFEQFKIDSHFSDFGQVKIDPTSSGK